MGLPTDAENVVATFKRFDKNGDGVITKEEMHNVFSKVAPDLTNEQVGTLLCMADLNGDGKIQYTEFVDWLRRGAEQLVELIEKDKSPGVGEAKAGTDRQEIEGFISDLEKDPKSMSKVLSSMPRSIREDVLSDEFRAASTEGFKAADVAGNSVLEFTQLFPLLAKLSEKHPFTLDDDVCMKITEAFDVDRNGFITSEDAVDFAKFGILIGHLYAARGSML